MGELKYFVLNVNEINDTLVGEWYEQLLSSKQSFTIIKKNNESYALTKEGSFFKLENIDDFINKACNDLYYKTIIVNNELNIDNDLVLFKYYLNKYNKELSKLYASKYLFGNVAIRTVNNAFITTIRGKENLDEYTIVYKVDHEKRLIYAGAKKATLNAPLLDNFFKNKKVKVVVHLSHYYLENVLNDYYAPSGTVRDSFRNNETSFNISHHGAILLFDEMGNQL
jgi:hypothetical protein